MKDYPSRYTEKEIQRIEKRLAREYKLAGKEVEEKLDNHLSEFKKQDKEYRRAVKRGTMTQEEYDGWRKDNLFVGQRWREIRNNLAVDMHNANLRARGITEGYMPRVYAESFNYGMYEIDKGTRFGLSFSLYDENVVRQLMSDNPKFLPKRTINSAKDIAWNTKKIASALTQGVVQGDSIETLAERLRSVTDMNYAASIRNARTMMSAAQNLGRLDSYMRLKERTGWDIKKQWLATVDGRTRHSHRAMDGQIRELEDEFSNGLMQPCDPNVDAPSEIYNCRCRLVPLIPEMGDEDLSDLSTRNVGRGFGASGYDDWKKGFPSYERWKKQQLAKEKARSKSSVVNGKDISGTWERRPDEFDFEIEDVINAQGFDGLPRVVSEEEFDELVKQANDGNGFIAQRTYSAPDQATLEAYRSQLYDGKWYVDCSTGGAQYGQGMYCAADWTGTLSDGIKAEMAHYQGLGQARYTRSAEIEFENKYAKELNDPNLSFDREFELFELKNRYVESRKGVSYTETMTLDRSAKIISYDDLVKEKNAWDYEERMRPQVSAVDKVLADKGYSGNDDAQLYLKSQVFSGMYSFEEQMAVRKRLGNDAMDELDDMLGEARQAATKAEIESIRNDNMKSYTDIGSFAVARGYDAINAEGHGESASYTVILNRTKLIIKEP